MKKVFFVYATLFALLAAPAIATAQNQNYVDMPVQEGGGGIWYTDGNGTMEYSNGSMGRLGCRGASWWPGQLVFMAVTFETPHGRFYNNTWAWDFTYLEHPFLDAVEGDWDWSCITESWVWINPDWVYTGRVYSQNRTATFYGSVPYRRGLFESRQGACNKPGVFPIDGFWNYHREGFCTKPGGCHGLQDTIQRCDNVHEWVTRDYKWIGLGHPLQPYVTLTCALTTDRPGVKECKSP